LKRLAICDYNMATIKLDDLLGKKKEAPQVLDLSRSIIQSKEEFHRLLDKVPEYKIRPEKVSLNLKDCGLSNRPFVYLNIYTSTPPCAFMAYCLIC
jgi:hypothetical protein